MVWEPETWHPLNAMAMEAASGVASSRDVRMTSIIVQRSETALTFRKTATNGPPVLRVELAEKTGLIKVVVSD